MQIGSGWEFSRYSMPVESKEAGNVKMVSRIQKRRAAMKNGRIVKMGIIRIKRSLFHHRITEYQLPPCVSLYHDEIQVKI